MANPKLETYQDSRGEWRWRVIARNGNITADGSEGYAEARKAKAGARSTLRTLAKAFGYVLTVGS